MVEPKGFGVSQEVIIYPIATSPKGAFIYHEVGMLAAFGLGESHFFHASNHHADKASGKLEVFMNEWLLSTKVKGEGRYQAVGFHFVMIERVLLFGIEVQHRKLEGICVIQMIDVCAIIHRKLIGIGG